MATKAPIQPLEIGLAFSFHKDVQTGCPDTTSKAQVRHKMDRNVPKEGRKCESTFVLRT